MTESSKLIEFEGIDRNVIFLERKKSKLGWFLAYAIGLLVMLTTLFVLIGSMCPPSSKSVGVESGISMRKTYTKEIDCQELHLAIVCGGYNSTTDFYILLKSILFHRKDKIHLHLFVDKIAKLILQKLFSTWETQDMVVYYYDMVEYEPEISWIPNKHYSGLYGLVKLVVFRAIYQGPHRAERVILLDSDMIVLGNIRVVWDEGDKFSTGATGKRTALGLVRNMSPWYEPGFNRTNFFAWKAKGGGYNSGLVLADLKRLDELDWSRLWRDEVARGLIEMGSTTLADQDVFNAVILSHPDIVTELPCSYNIQLGDVSTTGTVCDIMSSPIEIVHWNSPFKHKTNHNLARKYDKWYRTFKNWDAKLLEDGPCSKPEKQVIDIRHSANYDCSHIRPNPSEKVRTLIFYKEFELNSTSNDLDVTLVVHFSLDRIETFEQVAARWSGPMSVAIYLLEQEVDYLDSFIDESDRFRNRRNIGFHLVFKQFGYNYPINRLRNIALSNVITPLSLHLDADFVPSFGLYNYIIKIGRQMINEGGPSVFDEKGLVVPAFEELDYKSDFPMDKQQLITQLERGFVTEFRRDIWPQGHNRTDYFKWKASTTAYKVEWGQDYEPFLVTKAKVPLFDERFVGFGWNKVEWVMRLAAYGYEFFVLPDAFVVHNIHSPSHDIQRYRGSYRYQECLRKIKESVSGELRTLYPNFFKSHTTHL